VLHRCQTAPQADIFPMPVELEITTGYNGITILQPVMLARLAKHGAF
jgi:hypothetical protein